MAEPGQASSHALAVIAATGDRFSDFAPYVASINDAGVVAFQATLAAGGSGAYQGDGGPITTIIESGAGPLQAVVSHPDLNNDGEACFYAQVKPGRGAVILTRRGEAVELSHSNGFLGPTMNESGAVAFRIDEEGRIGVFVAREGRVIQIAGAADRFAAFRGLPVINASDAVAFRADLRSGGKGIYVGDGRSIASVVETGEEFTDLNDFPDANNSGEIAFCATLRSGVSGVFIAHDGEITKAADTSGDRFQSFRSALVNNAGKTVFCAVPTGGTLGIFTGPDPVSDHVLSIGAPLFGSVIADFALNPVSFNDAGQLAIRVRLEDGRQFVLRADPGVR